MTSKRLTYAGLLIAVVGCGGNDTFGTRDIASGESTTSGLKWITGFGGSQSQAYGVSSTGAVVVLKGQRTVVARPDGAACVNPNGNPGMATGGTGDVLSGIVGALLARGLDGWTAAVAAVYLHGAAGDDAAGRRGEESLVASDILDSIPAVLRRLRPHDARQGACDGGAHS